MFNRLPQKLFAQAKRILGIYFVALFTLLFSSSYSQVSTGYTWTYVTSPAHAFIVGGTALASGNGPTMDDAIYTNVPIGFTANFNGVDYTTVGVSTNGFIWFGSTNPATNEYNPISSATAMAGVISGYGANLKGRVVTTPSLKYITTGTCPNRILTVEWKDMIVSGFTTGIFSSNRIDIQITITETSNNIDIHDYDSPYLVSATYFGQVGLRGFSNADFKNRSVISCATNWNTSAAGGTNAVSCQIDGVTCSTFPVANARYRFTNLATVSTNTWNGSAGTDWFTAANWSAGKIPNSYNNLIIPAGLGSYPALTGSANASCKSLTIAAGATLTSDLGYTGILTASGNLSNDGTIINNGTNYIGLNSPAACTISGLGDFTAADLSLTGSCTVYSLSNNIILRKLSIGTGSTLSMNTQNLRVNSSFIQTGTINQSTGVLQIEDGASTFTNATFNENTGTTYFATGINTTPANQTIPSITYYNLKVNTNNGFTASIGNGSTVTCNNLGILNPSTAGGIANAVNAITVNANFDLAPIGNAPVFNLSNTVTIAGIMTLYQGIINTSTSKIIMNSSAAAAIVAGSGNTDYLLSYINGNLRRNIASGVIANYDFPLGDVTTSYYTVLLDNGLNGGGFSFIDSHFGALANHTDASMIATEPTEPGVSYTHISTEGVWFLDPNNQPAGGTYDVKMYINGIAGLVDDEFAILKRPSTSITGADWDNGGATATRPSSMLPGRTVASGYALRYGLTSFSQFGIASQPIPLPIELLSFTGRNNGMVNVLDWTTASELNNDYFTIERSPDGEQFSELTRVAAIGNSTINNTYSLIDKNPIKGTSYYRLKQTDLNGHSEIFKTVSVSTKTNPNAPLTIHVSPNPFTDEFTAETDFIAEFESSKKEDVTVQIINTGGIMVYTEKITVEVGINLYHFASPEKLKAGAYILRVTDGKTVIAIARIIKI